MSHAAVERYFAATTQAEIDAAETAIGQASSGPLTSHGSIYARSLGTSGRWFGAIERVPGGLCSQVLFGEGGATVDRFAHIPLVSPVPHPNGGGSTRVVPVLGLADRPRLRADGVVGESACDGLYRGLWRANQIVELARDQPEVIAEYTAQIARNLAAIAAGRAKRTWSAWESGEELPPCSVAPPAQRAPYEPAAVWGFRVFDDGTGLIAFAQAIVVFRLRDGKVVRVCPTGGAEYVAAPTSRVALLKAWLPTGRMHPSVPDRPDERQRAFALDLATGRWIARPDEPPAVWFVELMERSVLHDSDGRSLQLSIGDYPVINEPSPDHRFIWVEDKHGDGGIFRLRDGALVTPLPELGEPDDVPQLDKAGKVRRTPASFWQGATHAATALVHTPRGRWLTLRGGVVCEDGLPVVTLGGASKLAAFAPDGSALWIADGREVRCIELGPVPRIRVSWPYAPLRVAAGAPARAKPRLL